MIDVKINTFVPTIKPRPKFFGNVGHRKWADIVDRCEEIGDSKCIKVPASVLGTKHWRKSIRDVAKRRGLKVSASLNGDFMYAWIRREGA